jgi:ankyrin repeat protein
VDDFNRLIEAAKRGDEEDVISLLQRNSELINQRDEVGATALHYAAFGGHRKVAKLLVDRGADINARDGQFGATPAGWAIEYLPRTGRFSGN